MTDLEKNLVKYINDTTESNFDFIELFKVVLSITRMCSILNIKRNHYNYLARTNQLNARILLLKTGGVNNGK